MDRSRQILKGIALGLALLVVSTALARQIIPYQPRAELKLPEHSEILGFSPDGQILYTVKPIHRPISGQGPICAWDLQTGRERFRVAGDRQDVQIAFSADGRYLGTYAFDVGLKIWDARTGREIDFLKPVVRGGSVEFCFSPDGELLLLQDYRADESAGVMLWHIRERREVGIIDEAYAGQLVISPDAQRLSDWYRDDGPSLRQRLWRLSPNGPPALLAEHHWCADTLAISPDLSAVATLNTTGSEDSFEVILWDTHWGTKRDSLVVKYFEGEIFRPSIEFSGNYLVVYTGWCWWVLQVAPHLREVGAYPTRPAFSPDGKFIAAPLPAGAELLDANGLTKLGHCLNPLDREFGPPYPALAFSPDSRLLAVEGLWAGDIEPVRPHWLDGLASRHNLRAVIRLWDTQSGRQALGLEDCYEARFTPNGKTLLTKHDDDVIQIWDYPLRQPLLLTAFCSLMFWLLMALPIAFVRKLRQ